MAKAEAKTRVASIVLVAVGVGVVAVLAALAWQERTAMASAFGRLSWGVVASCLALVFVAYGLRFAKWLVLLRALHVVAPRRATMLVFGSGLLFSITPAKLGEFWKAWALAGPAKRPPAALVPVVAMERVTDLLAVVALGAAAAAFLGFSGSALWILAAAAVAGLVVLTRPGLWRLAAKAFGRRSGMQAHAEELATGFRVLARPGPLGASLALSLAAWGLEAATVRLVLEGMGFAATWSLGAWVFAAGTLAGLLTILPGGLGIAEVGMVALLVAAGAPAGVAGAATVVVRASTLGFGVLVGAAFLPFWLRWKAAWSAAKQPSAAETSR